MAAVPAINPAATAQPGTPAGPSVVTQEDVAAANDLTAVTQQYEVVKPLGNETWLVRRRDDPDAQFLGCPDDLGERGPQLVALLDRGAGWAVSALLNHRNLISIAETIAFDQIRDAKVERRRLLLWDYCDAGNLQAFMDTTRVPPQVDPETNLVAKWLPESLCWHVVTSVLRALAWMHEGYREEDTIVTNPDGTVERGTKADTREDRDEDWLSVLHRDVNARNIYFQHPRGTETYGLCKLGNYARVFVSGHVNDLSTGHVVCSKGGPEDRPKPLLRVVDDVKAEDIYTVTQGERPYFKGTDVYHLGEVLYSMMVRQAIPSREECPFCDVRHWAEPAGNDGVCEIWPNRDPFDLDVVLAGLEAGYSAELVSTLMALLSYHRASVDTAWLYTKIKTVYLQWKEGGSPSGRRYRDYWDDMVTRNENTARKHAEDERIAQAQSAPGAVDYVQLAMAWAQANARGETADAHEAATATVS